MDVVGVIVKQPFEQLDVSIDFINLIKAGETISLTGGGVTARNLATQQDSSSVVIASIPAPTVVGTKVCFRVQNGTNAARHRVTVRVVASGGERYETDADLNVVEL